MHLTEHHKHLLDVLCVYDYPGFSGCVCVIKIRFFENIRYATTTRAISKRENLPHLFLTSPSLNYVLPSFCLSYYVSLCSIFFETSFEFSNVCGHFLKKYDKIFFFSFTSRVGSKSRNPTPKHGVKTLCEKKKKSKERSQHIFSHQG